MVRTILLAGATGRTGRGFISAVTAYNKLSDESSRFRVLALSRAPDSKISQEIAKSPGIEVKKCDLTNQESVEKVFEGAGGSGSIWGVFCVLAFPGLGKSPEPSIAQGKRLADISLRNGVHQFVYLSVERGGEVYDDDTESSHSVHVQMEKYLKSLDKLRWTIIRGGFFMENFNGTMGGITGAILQAGVKPDTKIQLIAVSDIGRSALGVFKSPDRFTHRAFALVGDILTMTEMDETYFRVTGDHITSIPRFGGKILLMINKHPRGIVEAMEKVHSVRLKENVYDSHLDLGRETCPNLQSFEEWSQGFKHEAKEGWNGLSISAILSGRV